jgi:hypothetical protein
MEPLSRVIKNAELRQEVENSRESELTSSVLAPYADRLNRINPEISSIESSPNKKEYNPLHSKDDADPNFDSNRSIEDPAFHHDLLNEFIDEVKSYNIKRGYSASEDTDLNILNKISNPSVDIQKVNSAMDDQITQEIKRVITDDFEPQYLEPVGVFDKDRDSDVLEETAKIKIKLESVDKELLEMSRSVNSSSKVLNFIVFILVVVLLVMIGFAFYWIFTTQGFR